MRGRVAGCKQTTAETDQRVYISFRGEAVGASVQAEQLCLDLAAVCEQCHSVGANGRNDSLNLHELGVQAAVDQLIPGGTDRLGQFARSQPGDPASVDLRRE